MYEQQRDNMAAQAFNIDQTAFTIDSVKDTQTTVAAMKEASKVLKVENKKISLSEVEDMQDDLEGASGPHELIINLIIYSIQIYMIIRL